MEAPPTSLTSTVLVTNVSPNADEIAIANFFSFCGTILSLKVTHFPDQPERGSEALIVFETDGAAQTALLLNSAVIIDRPITVVAGGVSESSSPEHSQHSIELRGEQVPNIPNIPAEQRSKTSVIASMLAKGYILGQDAITKARAVDEENKITMTAGSVVVMAKEKIVQIDKDFHISEKVGQIANEISEKAKEVDNQWHISENVSSAVKNISESVEVGIGAIQTKANQTPVVQSTLTRLTQFGENVSNFIQPSADALKASFEDIKEQSNQLIEENRRDTTSVSRQTEQETHSPREEEQEHEHEHERQHQEYTLEGEDHHQQD